MAMPDEVQQVFGFALYQAQIGLLHPDAKPLKGFGSAGVIEIVEDWRGDAFRSGGLRPALLSKEGKTRNRNSEEGSGFDSGTIETS
jgi:hypothetical protein